MLSNKKLKYRCGLSKSMDSPDAIKNTHESEDWVINNMNKNINNLSKIKSYPLKCFLHIEAYFFHSIDHVDII